jgi:hypothetical protein
MSEIPPWTQEDRERIELYRLGHSVRLVARLRREPEDVVRKSVNMLLEVLGEKEVL